ncbi:MAG: hypothetical protein KGZ63_08390 [Clostridiales bacterium]|jgi:hypothetical protein|nr:hypothetical protein [Clostridiales bacterium]
MEIGRWCFIDETAATYEAPEILNDLYAEFVKVISQYFGVEFYLPEDFFSELESKPFSSGDIRFIKWLEDKGFPTFKDLLEKCCINDGKIFMQLEYELEMLQSLTSDLSELETDEDVRMDLRAYLINLVSYLPDIATKPKWSIEEKPHFLAKEIESANNADSIFIFTEEGEKAWISRHIN